jgi:signal transduction histidine kinase
VTLAVRDTGCGMEETAVNHIFDPCYTQRPVGVQGSGLGLAVVYGVAREHRGAIDVNTAPGRGAEFVLYLPPERPIVRRGRLEVLQSVADG